MHEDGHGRGAAQLERRPPVRPGAEVVVAPRVPVGGGAGARLLPVSVVGGHPLGLLGVCGALAGTHHVSRASTAPPRGLVLADLSCAACAPAAEELAALARRHPLVLLVDARTLGLAEEALQAGALGAVGVWEPVAELRRVVRSAGAGERCTTASLRDAGARVREVREVLSPQEREVLRLYGADLPVKTVARRMGITVGTAKEYLKRLRAKLTARGVAVSTKVDLRDLAEQLGLFAPAQRCGGSAPQPQPQP